VPGIIKINKGGPVFKYCVLNFRVMPECWNARMLCAWKNISNPPHKRAKRQKEELVMY